MTEHQTTSVFDALRMALGFVWRSARWTLVMLALAQVLAALALLMLLLSVRSLIAGLEAGDQLSSVTSSVVVSSLAFLVIGVVGVGSQSLQLLMAEKTNRIVQHDIMQIAVGVPYSSYEDPGFHDLLERTTQRTGNSSLRLVGGVLTILESVAGMCAVAIALARTVPALLPILLVVALPLLVASRVGARINYQMALEVTTDDRLRRSMLLALTSKQTAREARTLGLGASLGTRWDRLWDQRIALVRSFALRRMFVLAAAATLSALMTGGVLFVLVRATANGTIGLADASVAVLAFQQLLQRTRSTAQATGNLRESALFLSDFESLDQYRRPALDDGLALPTPEVVSFEDVSFRYPGGRGDVLVGTSFELRRGEMTALVGASGAGKSTLVHLLAGLYQPMTGRILWDGADLAGVDDRDRWRSTAVTFQDFGRFDLTAKENVELGDAARNDAEALRHSMAVAGISDVVERLPSGLDTFLSRLFPGGTELSVGQWQRLAVARALYRRAALLILDEPSAALDAESEVELIDALRAECDERVVLVVSHRFSTVRRADRILVLDAGRIVEDGSHDDLMGLDGRYARLFRLQMAEPPAAVDPG